MLLITEEEVLRLLDVPTCVDLLDRAFRAQAQGRAETAPRRRLRLPRGFFHYMAGACAYDGFFGIKVYATGAEGTRFHLLLYEADTGRLLAMIQAGHLGRIRTGSATGLATRYLAPPDASTVAVIGAGFQADAQLEAVCAVRPVREARVFSRSPQRREAFARRMQNLLGIPVTPSPSAREAAEGAQIVITITNSRTPVLEGAWLAPGVHVNAAGSNHWMRRELDSEAVRRADLVAVDDLEQARAECGDLIWPAQTGEFNWELAVELKDVVSGRVSRPDPSAITLFESQGVALEDVASAGYVYRRARQEGLGRELDF